MAGSQNVEEEDEEEDAMSDYIDENFELDETDEYWGLVKQTCYELKAHANEIKKIHLRVQEQPQ